MGVCSLQPEGRFLSLQPGGGLVPKKATAIKNFGYTAVCITGLCRAESVVTLPCALLACASCFATFVKDPKRCFDSTLAVFVWRFFQCGARNSPLGAEFAFMLHQWRVRLYISLGQAQGFAFCKPQSKIARVFAAWVFYWSLNDKILQINVFWVRVLL